MQSEKILLTAEELLSLPDTSNNYELIEGKLVEMPPGNAEHSVISLNLAYALKSYVDSNELGKVFGQDAGFILRRNPDTVLAPDVAFVAKERLPGRLPAMFLQLAPDLVAEVVSPNDRPREVQEKARAWLGAGVLLVWVVYPVTQTIVAFYADGQRRQFSTESDLTGEPVLPGLRCRVTDLFR